MGKSENRKRAKRLKEAKRKREQDALLAAGLGPASKILQERRAKSGMKAILNSGKVKYSELLTEFVQPIVNEMDDISIIRAKYAFGVHAWNSAILKEKSEDMYQETKKNIAKTIPDMPEIGQLFDEMVKRKQEEFFEYKNIIIDFEIQKIRGLDYDLTVATTPFKG